MKVSTMRDGGRGKIELSQLYEHVPKVQLAIAVAMEIRSVLSHSERQIGTQVKI